MNLFAYGTLMFPAVWRRVVGREFAAQPASVSGYEVFRVADGVYPVLVAAEPDDCVDGLIYRGLDAATLRRLDEYESDLYDRVEIQALLVGGESIACEAYVLPESKRTHASDEPWTAATFERDHLTGYLVWLH